MTARGRQGLTLALDFQLRYLWKTALFRPTAEAAPWKLPTGPMPDDRDHDIPRLLEQMEAGDKNAVDTLMPLVYAELRDIASAFLRGEQEGHTLQPTALVNEAYMRLVAQRDVKWKSKSHFIGIAAQAMRRILVDHARRRSATKRDGGRMVDLDEQHLISDESTIDILALNDLLNRLATMDERQARIVDLRFFGGLNVEEIAALLNVSATTVKREWRSARAWLRREIVDAEGAA